LPSSQVSARAAPQSTIKDESPHQARPIQNGADILVIGRVVTGADDPAAAAAAIAEEVAQAI
jgi:orotidine-5'-phosphate decarboxylase